VPGVFLSLPQFPPLKRSLEGANVVGLARH